METVLICLGAAFLIFAIVKAVFNLLSWFFPESDHTYRKQLDSFFDLLDEYTLFELGQIVLIRIVKPIHKFFSNRIRGYVIIGAVGVFLNALVVVLAIMVVSASHFFTFSMGIKASLISIEKIGFSVFTSMNVFIGLIGTIFDLLSLSVTLILLTKASMAKTGQTFTLHLSIDILVAAVSCMWDYVVLTIGYNFFYVNFLPLIDEFSRGAPERFIKVTL